MFVASDNQSLTREVSFLPQPLLSWSFPQFVVKPLLFELHSSCCLCELIPVVGDKSLSVGYAVQNGGIPVICVTLCTTLRPRGENPPSKLMEGECWKRIMAFFWFVDEFP